MSRRLIPMVVFLAVMVLVLPFLMRMGSGGHVEPVLIKSIDLGEGHTIDVTVEPNSQQTLSLHYTARVGDKTQVEHAFFGTLPRTAPPPKFVVYRAEDGQLIGLAQAAAPKQVVIVHDFVSGDSFPHRHVTYKDTDPQHDYPYYEEMEPILARGDALFDRLRLGVGDDALQLLRTMGTRPLTMPKPEPENRATGSGSN